MTARFDVIVVGAGPAGSSAAKACANEGLNVALLEKHAQAGLKVCTGGLEFQVVEEFNIDESVVECFPERLYLCDRKRWAERKMKYANVYRKKFDSYLAERATEAGAKFFSSTECVSVMKKDQTVTGVVAKSTKTESQKILGAIIIVADGFNSLTARSAGFQNNYSPSDIGVTIQCEVRTKSNVKNDSIYLFYGNDIANCGYGWIYPKSDSYTVGLGCLASQMQEGGLVGRFHYLVYRHPIASQVLSGVIEMSKFEGACVPLKQSDTICDNGIMVVGDAAGHVAALSGSGIYYAMKAGDLAGKVAAEAVSDCDVSKNRLQQYNKTWDSQHGKELRRQKKVLEKLDGYFGKYMEVQILLDNYPKVKKIVDASASIVKPFLFH